MYSKIIATTDYVDFFEETIKAFGGVSRGKAKYIMRKNVSAPYPEVGAYYGCISVDEEPSGAYSDLSIVIMPSNEPNEVDDRWMISLGVGSLGYKNDYQLVSLPGTRRIFVNTIPVTSFIKNDFLDIESHDGFSSFCDKQAIPETLRNGVKNYTSVLIASTVFDPNDVKASKAIIEMYLAIYASLRKWPTTVAQRKAVSNACKSNTSIPDEEKEISDLLERRKYVVLQGAPGTGKTRLAKKITKDENNVFFTQFHAETSYSDFVYGIVPDVNAGSLKYTAKEGVFVKAVKKAIELENSGNSEKVYLIIDEINRANLANVFGPCFYLFEPTMTGSGVKIELCPGLSIDKLPDNLYVIATMNTADRSLAVVDFALRRRFAWYTMYPHIVTADAGMQFCEDEFSDIADIFKLYATDEELNLQPGQAYYVVPVADAEQAIKNRMRYEVMPLIKEYLMDGMLSRAKDDFVNYFRNTLGEEMFR